MSSIIPGQSIQTIDISIIPFELHAKANTLKEARTIKKPFRWDASYWVPDGLKNVDVTFPTFWDPDHYPLTFKNFRSGYSDKDALSYVNLVKSTEEQVERWHPVVKAGEFFSYDKSRYLFSNEGIETHATLTGHDREPITENFIAETSLSQDLTYLDNKIHLSSVSDIYPGTILFLEGPYNILLKVGEIQSDGIIPTEPLVKDNLVVNKFKLDWTTSGRPSNIKPNITPFLDEGLDFIYDSQTDSYISIEGTSEGDIRYISSQTSLELDKFSELVKVYDYTNGNTVAADLLTSGVGWVISNDSEIQVDLHKTTTVIFEAGSTVKIVNPLTIHKIKEHHSSNFPIEVGLIESADQRFYERVDRFDGIVVDGVERDGSKLPNIESRLKEFTYSSADMRTGRLIPISPYKEFSPVGIFDEIHSTERLKTITEDSPLTLRINPGVTGTEEEYASIRVNPVGDLTYNIFTGTPASLRNFIGLAPSGLFLDTDRKIVITISGTAAGGNFSLNEGPIDNPTLGSFSETISGGDDATTIASILNGSLIYSFASVVSDTSVEIVSYPGYMVSNVSTTDINLTLSNDDSNLIRIFDLNNEIAGNSTYDTIKNIENIEFFNLYYSGNGKYWHLKIDESTFQAFAEEVDDFYSIKSFDLDNQFTIGDYTYLSHNNLVRFFVLGDNLGKEWVIYTNGTVISTKLLDDFIRDNISESFLADWQFELKSIYLQHPATNDFYQLKINNSGILFTELVSQIENPNIVTGRYDKTISYFIELDFNGNIVVAENVGSPGVEEYGKKGPQNILPNKYLGTISDFLSDDGVSYGITTTELTDTFYHIYGEGDPKIKKIVEFEIPEGAILKSIKFSRQDIFRHLVHNVSELDRDGFYYIEEGIIYLCSPYNTTEFGNIIYSLEESVITLNQNAVNKIGGRWPISSESVLIVDSKIGNILSISPSFSETLTVPVGDGFLVSVPGVATPMTGEVIYNATDSTNAIIVNTFLSATTHDFLLDTAIFSSGNPDVMIFKGIRPNRDSKYLLLSNPGTNEYQIISYSAAVFNTGVLDLTINEEIEITVTGGSATIQPFFSWNQLENSYIGTTKSGEVQIFYSNSAPILYRKDHSRRIKVFLMDPSTAILEEWTQAILNTFDHSSSTDKHFIVDYGKGQIIFGNGKNGKIPTSGKYVFAERWTSPYFKYEPQYSKGYRTLKDFSIKPNNLSEKNSFLFLTERVEGSFNVSVTVEEIE